MEVGVAPGAEGVNMRYLYGQNFEMTDMNIYIFEKITTCTIYKNIYWFNCQSKNLSQIYDSLPLT